MKIKDLSADERPREKMLSRGAQSLSDGELLAVLLRSGTREGSALDLARQLLDLAGGRLGALFNLPPEKMLPILALIFSILFPVVGLVMAIIDMSKCRSENRKVSSMTTVALIISALRVLLSIGLIIMASVGAILSY